MENKKRIKIYYSHGSCFLWHSKDSVRLRLEYRIVGRLSGIFPLKDVQDQHIVGLPQMLLPEEVILLLEKDFGRILDWPEDIPDFLKEEEIEDEEKKEAEGEEEVDEGGEEEEEQGEEDKEDREERGGDERKEKEKAEASSVWKKYVPLPTSTPIPREIREMDDPEDTVQKNQEFLAWYRENVFPRGSPDKAMRCAVFRDLWEKGHYMTSGVKFGGDYLVYPDDPFRVHATFIVTIIPYDRPVSMLDLVSWGRLAVTVKKSTVFASVSEEGECSYVTIDWRGV